MDRHDIYFILIAGALVFFVIFSLIDITIYSIAVSNASPLHSENRLMLINAVYEDNSMPKYYSLMNADIIAAKHSIKQEGTHNIHTITITSVFNDKNNQWHSYRIWLLDSEQYHSARDCDDVDSMNFILNNKTKIIQTCFITQPNEHPQSAFVVAKINKDYFSLRHDNVYSILPLPLFNPSLQQDFECNIIHNGTICTKPS